MNENLNLVEILKDCPKGTKLYSPLYGEVEFEEVNVNETYQIVVKTKNGNLESFTSDGRWDENYKGECLLFPSNEQRDWGKFKTKFDPKTLQPFDKVLIQISGLWCCDFYSSYNKHAVGHYLCFLSSSNKIIPYNEDTKHLVGTAEEAPEFYRFWED